MTPADELKAKLQEAWERARPLMMRRLNAIERAHEAAVAGTLTDALKTEAAQEAHKLAGSLGVFGVQGGSESALEIEQILASAGALGANEVARLHEDLQRLMRDVQS